MKYALLSIFTFFCALSQGQPVQGEYSNVLTAAHQNIPGTKVFLTAGEGFVPATNFTGLMKDGNTGIIVYDLDGGNFSSNARNFRKETFEAKGLKVREYAEFKINGYPARYASTETGGIVSHQMVSGDSTFSVLLVGSHTASDVQSSDAIRASLLSLVYDKNFRVDALKLAPFTLDDSGSRYKFAKASSNIYLYTAGGANKASYDNEPSMTVTTFPNDGSFTAEKLTVTMLRELEDAGTKNFEILSATGLRLNGYDAYEVNASGFIGGVKKDLYQLAVATQDRSIVMLVTAPSGSATDIAELRKLARTLKIK